MVAGLGHAAASLRRILDRRQAFTAIRTRQAKTTELAVENFL
jgi:hypothetical protein